MSVTAEFDWNVVADAELVGAAAAGDRAAFAEIYDRYATRLYDFCAGIVGDRDAADCVQEAFYNAAVDLPKLRDPDKLRPWLYTIARHQALRTLRARQRETVSDELPDEPSSDAGPDTQAARNELAVLVAQAEGGLSQRDREVLDLAYRHGLTNAEIGETLGVSGASAKKMVQRLRDTVEQSLGALLIARQASSGQNRCPDLASTMTGWDGQFTILVRKRISRHITSCPNCDEDRGRLVNPTALLGTSAVLIPAPAWLREQTLSNAPHPLAGTTAAAAAAGHAAKHVPARLFALTGRFTLVAAAVVAVPAVIWGVSTGPPAPQDTQVTPVTSVEVKPVAPTTIPLQRPSNTAAPQPNVPATEPNTSVRPSSGPVDTDIPNPENPGNPPIEQAPPPHETTASVPSSAPTVTRTSHAAPASVAPSPPAATRQHTPQQPPAKHCQDGSTVDSGQSCPTPQAPARPNCPHVAVPGNPICGRTTEGN
ncbi:RNA polymerase sigma factor [Mycobacterium sp.]|uniref:RNA polymerase sigma factor n=1 Tax=Mycobacterium sp. TaxID=1785 RepID=UPI002CA334C5|nr:sigma-70 family RNA polymerase sigma factor [Mycobacterium sp.]HKP39860.1 sigma-70 family RNA polymerase sigma factor [Mycobacterium sp.]